MKELQAAWLRYRAPLRPGENAEDLQECIGILQTASEVGRVDLLRRLAKMFAELDPYVAQVDAELSVGNSTHLEAKLLRAEHKALEVVRYYDNLDKRGRPVGEIIDALGTAQNNHKKAAKMLGMTREGLLKRIRSDSRLWAYRKV